MGGLDGVVVSMDDMVVSGMSLVVSVADDDFGG